MFSLDLIHVAPDRGTSVSWYQLSVIAGIIPEGVFKSEP